MTALLALPGRLWGYLAAGVALAGLILAALLKARQSGVAAQVAAQAQTDMEAARVRIDEAARAARAADPVGELRRRWGR